ncbi:MAG: hypothetical protein MUF42_05880 [Cytophagaceae bacterium]|jgi:hypothetical protein|nr:hypothetical protein [Cytophagaceae bacterium]
MRRQQWLAGVVTVWLVLSFSLQAQFKTKREYSGFFDSYYYRGPIAFTVGLGPSLYRGDYSEGFYSSSPGFSFAGGANYKVWPRCVYGLQVRYTSFRSTYSDSAFNYSYSGNVLGFDLYGRFYLLDDIVRISRDRKKFRKNKFYLTYGASILRYGRFGLSFPVGLNYSYDFSQRLSLHAGFSHHFMFSDRLDGLKKGGPDAYALIQFTVQFSPWAPKGKLKLKSEPPPPNPNRQEHQEWRKKKDKPAPPPEESEDSLPEGSTPPENSEEQNGTNQETVTEEEEEPKK